MLTSMLQLLAIALSLWALFNVMYGLRRDYFMSKGLKLYYGIVLVWKRKASIGSSRLVKILSYAMIPFAAYGIYLFYANMIMSILAKAGVLSIATRPRLLIPGINVTGMALLYFAIAVLVAAAIHELSHAYSAKSMGIGVRSIGVAVLFIIPVAFTEIDEDSYRSSGLRERALTLVSGPSANIAMALIFITLLTLCMTTSSLTIVSVVNGSLADKYGLKPNSVILEVNGYSASLDNLRRILSVNKTITISLKIMDERGTIREITIVKPWNTTRLGVYLLPYAPKRILVSMLGVQHSLALISLIYWLYLINLSLGILNIAPLFITDGGKLVYEMFKKRMLGHIVNAITLAILIAALTP